MRPVSRDGSKRKSSGNGAGIAPAENYLKKEIEASTLFSSGCNTDS